MPLYTYACVDGTYKPTALALRDEINKSNFSVSGNETLGVSFFDSFLCATFNENVQHVPENPRFNQHVTQLADFINSNINGPYYVFETSVNSRALLHITLFDQDDIRAFAKANTGWKFDPNSSTQNARILNLWQDGGQQLDERLQNRFPSNTPPQLEP